MHLFDGGATLNVGLARRLSQASSASASATH
jgi:hypothetical protein